MTWALVAIAVLLLICAAKLIRAVELLRAIEGNTRASADWLRMEWEREAKPL